MDSSSGALTPVPGSPIAGPIGIRGRMFLSTDQHTLISVGEGGPSIKYSINSNDGSLTRVQSINFSDNLSDFIVVAIDAGAQFMYAIDQYKTADAHPFHLHTNSFQLIAVNDRAVSPFEVWDTFLVPPQYGGPYRRG